MHSQTGCPIGVCLLEHFVWCDYDFPFRLSGEDSMICQFLGSYIHDKDGVPFTQLVTLLLVIGQYVQTMVHKLLCTFPHHQILVTFLCHSFSLIASLDRCP